MSNPVTDADFTVKEFARRTQQSEQCVYRKIRSGQIPSYRVGSAVRIRREDFEAIRRPSNRLTPELLAEIRKAVDNWPPLTQEQRDAIAALFSQPESGEPSA